MDKQFRNNGAIGALLDEYEKAIKDLYKSLEAVTNDQLSIKVDSETKDMNCVSIQSILTHLVSAGEAYNTYISNHIGKSREFKPKEIYISKSEFISAMNIMFDNCFGIFQDIKNNEIEQNTTLDNISTSWGQSYDIEQLMEHAIVHVLRHRRQIERFQIKLEDYDS